MIVEYYSILTGKFENDSFILFQNKKYTLKKNLVLIFFILCF